MIRYTVFFFFLFCVLRGYSQQASPDKNSSVKIEIEKIMDDLRVIGLAVAVVDKGKIVYQESFGYKSLDTDKESGKEPLRNEHIFRIASISKTFVATAIFQLIEQGRLNLEDDVNRYLDFNISNPNYPNVPITVKMLLSHRSSINDSQKYFSFDLINPLKGKNYHLCYNDYAPGEGYQYCNYNYNLLGAIIENVSGERFDNYIEKYITSRLKSKGSFNVDRLEHSLLVPLYRYDKKKKSFKEEPEAYKSYKKQLDNYKLGLHTPFLSPTGGMKISAGDLAKYMTMHIHDGKYGRKRFISKKSEKLIREVVTLESAYALSFKEYKGLILGESLCGQTGGAYGLFSAMIFNPKEKYGFVVITNGCNSIAIDGYQDLHKSVIKCLYDNLIKRNR